MNPVIDKFISLYKQLGDRTTVALDDVYHQHIEFHDPVHRFKGLDNLRLYFKTLMENLISLDFKIEEITESDNQAFIQWIMTLQHPRLANGSSLSVYGLSHIKYDSRVYYHRDYFDLGEMVYEHIPILGKIIQKIKYRLSS